MDSPEKGLEDRLIEKSYSLVLNSENENRKQQEGAVPIVLQIIVDDVDTFAEVAEAKGMDVHGPIEERGKKVYSITAPDRMPVVIQSSIALNK